MRATAVMLAACLLAGVTGCENGQEVGQAQPTASEVVDGTRIYHRTGPDVPVTRAGEPVQLTGQALHPGDAAPVVRLVTADRRRVDLGALRGEVLVISVAPSLETTVCSEQCRRFDELSARLGPGVTVVNVTADPPLVQQQWSEQHSPGRIALLSDTGNQSFGRRYGVLMSDSQLLARSVFVVDADGVIRYIQVVGEQTQPPVYDAVVAAVQRVRDQQEQG